MSSLGRRVRRLRRRLWWFDVVYPITVALLIFSSLTYIVYAGQPSSRLSLLAEQTLLETSLNLGRGRQAVAPGRVLIVSSDALDTRALGAAPLSRLPEPHVSVYARVVQKLADSGVNALFLRWHPDAHPNDLSYYEPLITTLRNLPPATRVWLVTSASAFTATTPPELNALFGDRIRLAEDETCNYPELTQTDCPFNPEWPAWIMQTLIAQSETTAAAAALNQESLPPWLTRQLPSISPSFILNLPAPASIPTVSFRALLAGLHEFSHPPATAFIGSDLNGSMATAPSTSLTRFVRTVYDDADLDFGVAGTPLHVFWAMTAQMLHDGAVVNVPPGWAIDAMAFGFCLMVCLVMARFGGTAASGVLVVFVLSGPYMNAWSIRTLNIYAPLFDSFYFGLSTFIVAGFGRLSYTAFQRWRLAASQRLHAHTADLKGNFISLLSHNLNTPVAKMQGMLSVIATAAPSWRDGHDDAKTAVFHVTQLEYCIRGVLVAAALEEASLNESTRPLKAVLDELESGFASSLRRLRIELRAHVASDEEELMALPLTFDLRALCAAWAGLAALSAHPEVDQDVQLILRGMEMDGGPGETRTDRRGIMATFNAKGASLPEGAVTILTSAAPVRIRHLAGQNFYAEVLAGLAAVAARAYDGQITVATRPDGYQLDFIVWERDGDR